MSCEFLSEWQHVAGLFYWDTMENPYAVNEKNKFSGDIVIQHKREFTAFFIKNTHAFACVSFLVFRFFHDPAFSCTFIAIFPAKGTAIAADGTSVLISHITQCHTKDDKQKLSHTIPPLI